MKFRILTFLVLATIASAAAPREEQWRAVADAIQQGLPRTALEKLQPIVDGALQDRAWAEAAKAIGRRVVLESQIEGNLPEERVKRFAQALESAPPPLHPTFHALLAHAYWGYFDQNRWRIQGRGATDTPQGQDFQSWDLRRLFQEIDQQFSLALTNASALQAIPIADFAQLLEPGTMPDRYRPTLYDFLVHEALQFYSAGEQAGARPEDAFVLESGSPIFDLVPAFLAWRPQTSDTNAVAFKAIALFQDLLRFHENDPDPGAFLDANLARLRFGGNFAVGPDKDERLLKALQAFAEAHASHEVSAMARHEAAQSLMRQEKPGAAHAEATLGTRQFPNSPGGRLCRNLLLEIEAPQTRLQTERIWNAPWPTLDVHHKNTPRLWFRVVASDWNAFLDRRRNRPENMNRDERLALLSQRPVTQWSAELPPTPDFQERLTHLPAPETLANGFYFVLASRREDFAEENNEVSMVPIWVSDLSLVVRSRAGRWEGFVLDAASGEPISGARIEAWYLNQRAERVAVTPTTTDALGSFSYDAARQGRGYLFKATYKERTVAMGEDLWWTPRPEPRRAQESTIFFTDRAIYRPGQLIQYKGIAILADATRSRYEPIPQRAVVVLLRDPNGQEIARARHRANDFGSFAGSFTAPREGITGTMQILVEGEPAGATQVQVEEYKRPKFQVSLDAPSAVPRLNERVTLTGRATAYTGAPIDAGKVTWRVRREVRFPIWARWFMPMPGSQAAQEIAHGTATTRSDGSFTIEFTAVPDRSIPESNEPTFQFVAHADVTDGAGETRSDERRINIGYTALEAEIASDDWQTGDSPVELRISTKTLDGDGRSSTGVIKVYALKQPDRVHRASLDGFIPFQIREGRPAERDLSDPNQWEPGTEVARQDFSTGTNGFTTNRVSLTSGAYRAELEVRDDSGKTSTARRTILVLDPEATSLGIRVPSLVAAKRWDLEPGEELTAIWGTGYAAGRAFVEIEHEHELLARFWTGKGQTQQRITHAVTEAMRGGFTLHITFIRENRLYQVSRHVEVPWNNKEFELTWETFRSRLEPGQKETWTAVIKPKPTRRPSAASAESIAAEMVATLYDASLDQFLGLSWPDGFQCFPDDYSTARVLFCNRSAWFDHVRGRTDLGIQPVEIRYRDFPPDLVQRGGGMTPMVYSVRGVAQRTRGLGALGVPAMTAAAPAKEEALAADSASFAAPREKGAPETQSSGEAIAQVVPRRNLQETAFFLPQLTSDSNGVVRMTFTLPEALTEWRFLGFAHDRGLRSGRLEGSSVTARELMVQPNPPRFVREGDVIEFSAKVVNQSETRQQGTVQLHLTTLTDEKAADAELGNRNPDIQFDVPAKESRSYSWRLQVPDGIGFLGYKVVAAADRVSDGEEGQLPVLARRVFLTESMSLPIRGPATEEFTFTSLRDSKDSETLRHSGLTVQLVSNPAWYAVLALPYLMEYPHECTEQVFHRFYANSLAHHIAARDARIKAVFDQWRATPALDSPLEKNPDLKSVAIEETPWLREAKNESEARRQVAVLFENTRMEHERSLALQKLAEMQLADGGWPWFPGGPLDEYMTLTIATGFGRLRHLGIEIPVELPIRALPVLDRWMHERWQRLKDQRRLDVNNLDPTVALYLYTRAFFIKESPLEEHHRASFEYWLGQARTHALQLNHRLPQGHIALALGRLSKLNPNPKDTATAQALVRSLRERSVNNPELGMFWREDEASWWWYRAPIETQALMVELFDEVASDTKSVEDLKVWLVKQKQTQSWRTTKATADAVYALLLRGTDLLAASKPLELTLGDRHIRPGVSTESEDAEQLRKREAARVSQPEPGTGFYESRVPGAEVSAKLSQLVLKKEDAGVAWASVHWQYFEDLSKVAPYKGTPLHVTKALFTRTNSVSGPRLTPVTGPVQVGDELIVRLELRVDRDMEYVHLKDQRGSGTEPVHVLSSYRFQDGLAYYQSTRDTASHFFISYLPKGSYVFEYPLRIQHRGDYPAGFASVQCLYAPEFNSHSGNVGLKVE